MVFALFIIGHEGVKEREVLCRFPFPHKYQEHKLCPHFSRWMWFPGNLSYLFSCSKMSCPEGLEAYFSYLGMREISHRKPLVGNEVEINAALT